MLATLHTDSNTRYLYPLNPQREYRALGGPIHHANYTLLENPSHVLLKNLPPRPLSRQLLTLLLHFPL